MRQKSDSKVGTAETLASGRRRKIGKFCGWKCRKIGTCRQSAGKWRSGQQNRRLQRENGIGVREYLLVDGYNIIFSWDELNELAKINIDSARGKLLDILCDYQGSRGIEVIAVFDAYRVQGHRTEVTDYHNIHVVFTKEAEDS